MNTSKEKLATKLLALKEEGYRVPELLGAIIELVNSDIKEKASRELALVRTELETAQLFAISAYEHLTPSEILQYVQERKALKIEAQPPKRMFPICLGVGISGLPWEMLAPQEAYAMHNHSQTLEAIASRGGLSAYEAYCVIRGFHLAYSEFDKHEFYSQELIRMVNEKYPTEKAYTS